MKTILIYDPNPDLALAWSEMLQDAGYTTIATHDLAAAQARLASHAPGVLLVSVPAGAALCGLDPAGHGAPVAIATGVHDVSNADGRGRYLRQPFTLQALLMEIHAAAASHVT